MKRAVIERILASALGELDVAKRVRSALPARPVGAAHVVAIGKAAPAMAAGAIGHWGSAIERCVVVAPDDVTLFALERASARARLGERLFVMHAGHPLPDARSVRAGRVCLEEVASARRRELLVLVSGGASALACAPAAGVTLAATRAITRAMLESGASVQDINVVRRHLSRIKGGGLLRQAGSASMVRTLVASDVIGGSASDVGSGPSLTDSTSVADARRLLARFAPSFKAISLAKTYSPRAAAARKPRPRTLAKIVVSPEELARAAAALLRARGIDVRILAPSQAPVDELAGEYAALARRGRRRAFVRAAEPSVAVAARPGRGGRSTHLAALVGRALDDVELPGVTFAALASDGVDGRSGTGGAVVDGLFAARVADRLGDTRLDRALMRFDTGTLHRAMGTAISACPTGHNLADLHILVVA